MRASWSLLMLHTLLCKFANAFIACVSYGCAVQGLRALDRVFGSDTNSKGFKVIRGAGVIQVGGLL
jgi:hypothetical protein